MLTWISLLFFFAFLLVAAVDGIYYHLHRFRLWAQRDTWWEHVLHTVRAALVPAMLWALFAARGPAVHLLVALVVLDVVVTVLDVRVEKASRRRFGGLPRGEWIVHVVATLLHVAALGAGFAAKLAGEALPPGPWFTALVVASLLGSAVAAAHHVALAVRGAPGCCAPSRTSTT